MELALCNENGVTFTLKSAQTKKGEEIEDYANQYELLNMASYDRDNKYLVVIDTDNLLNNCKEDLTNKIEEYIEQNSLNKEDFIKRRGSLNGIIYEATAKLIKKTEEYCAVARLGYKTKMSSEVKKYYR